MAFRKLTPNDILPLIADYLTKAGLPDVADQLAEYQDGKATSLHSHSLVKMIKQYIKIKPQLLKEYTKKTKVVIVEETEEEEEEVVKEKPQKIKSATQTNGNHHQSINGTSNGNGVLHKRVAAQVTVDQEEQDDYVEQPKKRFFQKVDDENIHTLRAELRDNTFEAKQRFGTGDAFGELGNEKLRFARGENFKKEKGKLKNRQFQGAGSINMHAINSIKF